MGAYLLRRLWQIIPTLAGVILLVFILFNETCPACKPRDMQLIERMQQARQFGQAIKYARQRLFAAYDMRLASAQPGEPMQVWTEM